MAIDRSDKPRPEPQITRRGREVEALRVEAEKRAAIAKAERSGRHDLAVRLVEAIYKVFPPQPEIMKGSRRPRRKRDAN